MTVNLERDLLSVTKLARIPLPWDGEWISIVRTS